MTDSASASGYCIPFSVSTHISEMKPVEEQHLRPNGNSADPLRFKLTTHGNDEYSAVEMEDENPPNVNQTTDEDIYSHRNENAGCVCSGFSYRYNIINLYLLLKLTKCTVSSYVYVLACAYATQCLATLRDNIVSS